MGKKNARRYLKKEGKKLPNFTTGYWTPPLTGEQVFESEAEQMNAAGLDTIVSITDHDCIEATLELRSTHFKRFSSDFDGVDSAV